MGKRFKSASNGVLLGVGVSVGVGVLVGVSVGVWVIVGQGVKVDWGVRLACRLAVGETRADSAADVQVGGTVPGMVVAAIASGVAAATARVGISDSVLNAWQPGVKSNRRQPIHKNFLDI